MEPQQGIETLIDQLLKGLDTLSKSTFKIGFYSENLCLSIEHLNRFKTKYTESFSRKISLDPDPPYHWTDNAFPLTEKERLGVWKGTYEKNQVGRNWKKRKMSEMMEEHGELFKMNRGPSLVDFEFLKVIGRGAYAECRLCVYKPKNQIFCCKVLARQDVYRRKQVDHVFNEKLILQNLSHRNIVKLFMTFNDNKNLYFMMEHVPGGELFSYIQQISKFSEDSARFYAAEIYNVIEFLHSRQIVYRDLKPENILLDRDGHIKLIDFGFAKTLPDREKIFFDVWIASFYCS